MTWKSDTVRADASSQGEGPYGHRHLAGNAWEWVADWRAPYDTGRQVDPIGPASGRMRVVRGGSWDDPRGGARCAYRSRDRPGSRLNDFGFRVVLRAAPVRSDR